MFGGWLTEVYAAARDAWHLDDEDLAAIAGAAVDASFAEDGAAHGAPQPGSSAGSWRPLPRRRARRYPEHPTGWSPMDLVSPPDLDPLERLAASIREREAVVAVVGLGYVGLPLLVAIRHAGYPAIGFDTDATKIDELRAGRSYLSDISSSELTSLERVTYADDARALADADIVVLCLPTPLADGAPDLSMVAHRRGNGRGGPVAAGHAGHPRVHDVAGHDGGIPPADPGGGRSRRRRRLRARLLPRAHRPGPEPHRIHDTPKIVSGLTDRCRDLAVSFYAPIVHSIAVTPRARARPRWPS